MSNIELDSILDLQSRLNLAKDSNISTSTNPPLAFSKVGGIDYSNNLVDIAKRFLPNASISQGEANSIDISEKYDCVSSFSVFHYFSNISYAKVVSEKMIEKANKKVLFLDILDIDKKEADIAYKRELYGSDYERVYGNLPHFYYTKDFFTQLAKDSNCKIEIAPQNIKGYANSQFRFNAILTKEQ